MLRSRIPRFMVTALGAVLVACGGSATTTTTSATPAPATAPAQTTAVAVPAVAPGMVAPDSFAAIRNRAEQAMLQRIAGKENMPAESVFTNIKVLKRVPAGRLLAIMNNGFGRGLGVSCGFCHVPGRWASDEKAPKQIARDMLALVGRVNMDLRAIPNLPDSNAVVNCSTCHRGQPKPIPNGQPRGG